MAEPALLPANFVNPAYATPEQIASQREYAKFLTDNSMQPVHHWTEGVANLTRALMGGYQGYKADEAQRGLNLGTAQQYASLLNMVPGGAAASPAAPVAPSPSAPAPATAAPAASTATPDTYAAKLAQAESSGNPNERAKTSSATGLYQFTDSTWSDLMRRHPELGLTADGRTNPAQQDIALKAFTADNGNVLKQAGIPADDRNLRLAHFLGAGGASGFINGMNQNPNAPATSLVSPAAAQANQSVFFDKAGNPVSAQSVYDRQTAGFGGPPQAPPVAGPGGPATPPAALAAALSGPQPLPMGPAASVAPMAPPQQMPPPMAGPAAAPSAPSAAPATSPAATNAAIASSGIDPQQKQMLVRMLMNPATAPMAQKIVGDIVSKNIVPSNPDWVPIGEGHILDKHSGRVVAVDENKSTPDIKNYNMYVQQAKAAGQTPKTLEQYEIGMKQAGAMTNNIALNTEKKGQELLASKAIEGYDNASTSARDSQKRIALYDEMDRAAKAFTPGATAGAKLEAKRYLRDAGLIQGEDVPDQEIFRMLQQQLAVHAQPKGQGAVSNFERDMFAKALPNMTMSPEALTRAIDINRKLETFDMNVAKIYRDNARKNGGIPNYLEVQDQIAGLGSPLSDADHRLIQNATTKAAAAGGGATAAPAAPAKTLRLNPATGQMEPVQ